MSGGKLHESFRTAGWFSNRLVFPFEFLLGERWLTSEKEMTEAEDTLFPCGIVVSLLG